MKSKSESSLRWSLTAAILVSIVATIVVFVLVWGMGAVGAGQRGAVVVASIGLIGTTFAATVTAIGLLIKDSLDRRAQALQYEAEARLKAETSLKAIELMTAKDLSTILAQERREGAIIALSSLGYRSLILLLCERYWKNDQIDTNIVMGIVDECLQSDILEFQVRATSLLNHNLDKICKDEKSFSFPPSIYLKWKDGFSYSVKMDLANCIVKALFLRTKCEWEHYILNQFLYSLFLMASVDTEQRFKVSTALYALRLCAKIDQGGGFMPPDSTPITFEEIRLKCLEILGYTPNGIRYPSNKSLVNILDRKITSSTYETAEKIEDWSS